MIPDSKRILPGMSIRCRSINWFHDDADFHQLFKQGIIYNIEKMFETIDIR